jgi:hypothetical protein
MMLQFTQPIPCIVEDSKEGYILYVKDSGMFDNDEFCVVLKDGGMVRHYLSKDIKIFFNSTYGIKK